MPQGNYDAYWGPRANEILEDRDQGESRVTERVVSPERADKMVDDYFGGPQRPAMPLELPDEVPWTVQSAEEIGEATGAVDVTGAPEAPQVDTSGLTMPPHTPPGAAEIGYGLLGAPAPFVPSRTLELEQKIVIAVAEKIVAEQRPLLVQLKAAEGCHIETYPFASGATVTPPVRVGTRHPNGIGYLILASGSGLYVGENQMVGIGNMGMPVPTGTDFLPFPANVDLWISSAGAELCQATSLYIVQLYMGATTL